MDGEAASSDGQPVLVPSVSAVRVSFLSSWPLWEAWYELYRKKLCWA